MSTFLEIAVRLVGDFEKIHNFLQEKAVETGDLEK
jgi:hypothetical protein